MSVPGDDGETPEWFAQSDWRARGRVRTWVADGDHVSALIDMNGDGKYFAYEVYRRYDDGWVKLLGQDDVGDGPGWISGWSAGLIAFIFGQAEPGTELTIEFADDLYWVRANEQGMWAFVRSADGLPDWVEDAPQLFDS